MGPTCVGKTDISIELINNFNFEIISVDSCMIYKNMNIGTGKPGKKILKKIKHNLIDIINPEEKYSVIDFCKISESIIKKCFKKKKRHFSLVEQSCIFGYLKNIYYLIKNLIKN